MTPDRANLERSISAEFALDIEDVLNHVRCLAVVHVSEHVVLWNAHQRRLHAARIFSRPTEGSFPGQLG